MSSPLLKGGVLLSQQKGAVEEAPNDGYSYARYWSGTDYAWNNAPKFTGTTIDTGGTLYLYDPTNTNYLGITQNGTSVAIHSDTDPMVFSIGALNALSLASYGISIGKIATFYDDAVLAHAISLKTKSSVGGDISVAWCSGADELEIGDASYPTVLHGSDYAIKVGGTEKVTIDASGQVGIGTTNPVTPLTIYAPDGSSNKIKFLNDATGGTASDGFEIGITTTTPYLDALLWQREAANMRFATSNAERMRIDSSGYTGIGTTSPLAQLHVVGAGGTHHAALSLRMNSAATSHLHFSNLTGGSTNRAYILHNVYRNSSGTYVQESSTDGFGGIGFTASGTMDFFTGAAAATPLGVAKMTLDASGRLSIGTAQSSYPFSVYGDGNQFNTVWSSGSNGGAAFIARAHGTGQAQVITVGGGQTAYVSSFEFLQSSGGAGYVQNRANASIYFLTNATLRGAFGGGGGFFTYGSTTTNKYRQSSNNGTYYNEIYSNLSDSVNYGIVFSLQGTSYSQLARDGYGVSLDLLERSTAPVNTAAWGKLWVKNTTPCELWFTDDNGTSTKIV